MSLVAGSLGIAEQPKEKQKSIYGTPEICYPTNCYFVREFLLLVASGKTLALRSHTCYASSFEIVEKLIYTLIPFTCTSCLRTALKVSEN